MFSIGTNPQTLLSLLLSLLSPIANTWPSGTITEGMNCGLCSSYLAYSHNIPKIRGRVSHCSGCRPRNKDCAFVKKRCEKIRNKEIDFCYRCTDFPCNNLKGIVKGYKKYNYNIIDNSIFIKNSGLIEFIKKEITQYTCPVCGDIICIHNKKCYTCDKEKIC